MEGGGEETKEEEEAEEEDEEKNLVERLNTLDRNQLSCWDVFVAINWGRMTFGGRLKPVCGRSSIIVSLVTKKRTIQRDDEEQAEDDDDDEEEDQCCPTAQSEHIQPALNKIK